MPPIGRRYRATPLLTLFLALSLTGQAAAGAALEPTTVTSGANTAIGSVADSFEGALDPSTWAEVQAPATVSGGRLVIPAERGYGYVRTAPKYDLTDGELSVEVPQVPSGPSGEAFLIIGRDSSNEVSVIKSGANLIFRSTVAGSTTAPSAVPYDAALHRWWRIRNAHGITYWETSADGVSWTARRSAALDVDLTSAYVQLRAGHWGTESAPGSAVFDNVNGHLGAAQISPAEPTGPTTSTVPANAVAPPSSVPTVAVPPLSDDFNAGLDEQRWVDVQAPATVSDGRVRIPVTTSYGHLRSSRRYDLTGAEAAVEVVAVPRATAGQTIFEIGEDEKNSVSVVKSARKLAFVSTVDGVQSARTVSWDATAHRWWRIREAAGTIHWETSPDASRWTVQHSSAVPVQLTSASVTLRAGLTSAAKNPGLAMFDNVVSNMRPVADAATTPGTTPGTTVPPTSAPADPLAGTPAVANPVPQVAIPAGWQLRFQDEFSGTAYDKAKWNPSYPHGDGTTRPTSNFYNGELQAFVESQVLVKDGSLRLRAEPASPAITAFGDAGDSRSMPYKSGMVVSKGAFSTHFAYAEVRFRVPGGQGSWPAIWMLDTAGAWPPEIDLMETVNNETDRIHHSLHASNSSLGKRVASKVGPDFKNEWHTVGVLWQKTGATTGSVQFYVDGQPSGPLMTGTLGELIPDEPMYLLLNLSVGGSWPGNPDASTSFPLDFAIDYVRVWAP